ncbi:MAG: hypothetical protein HYR56_10340 [Acidobacteria bacterium]|nr:hypothetical protein [Acidobacteriota bacterium]MBI3425641.1 hypothetical protein [Acidobacteriota bacterium]
MDLQAEFTALAADFRRMEEEQDDINSDFDKRQKRFEVALNKLAFLVGEVSKEGLKLYTLQEETDQRLKELEKNVGNLVVMMTATNRRIDETNNRFDTWLKLEQKRRRNGHNGSNGKRN